VARKPETPPLPTIWTIYKAAAKQIRLGEVEAADEREAVEKAAKVQAACDKADRCAATSSVPGLPPVRTLLAFWPPFCFGISVGVLRKITMIDADVGTSTFDHLPPRLRNPDPDDPDRLAPAFITSRSTAASPALTRLTIVGRLKPWPCTSSSSLAPCRLRASSFSARRCSAVRRRFWSGSSGLATRVPYVDTTRIERPASRSGAGQSGSCAHPKGKERDERAGWCAGQKASIRRASFGHCRGTAYRRHASALNFCAPSRLLRLCLVPRRCRARWPWRRPCKSSRFLAVRACAACRQYWPAAVYVQPSAVGRRQLVAWSPARPGTISDQE
jgi:hypothetical protein